MRKRPPQRGVLAAVVRRQPGIGLIERNQCRLHVAGELELLGRQGNRLLDLRHASRLDAMERAFAALGRTMDIVVKAAA